MISKEDIVYISGPMSGLPDFNIPAFISAEYALRYRFGCQILNPARVCLENPGKSWTWYMRQAVKNVHRATFIVSLDGWQESRGATIEGDLGAMKGIMPIDFTTVMEGGSRAESRDKTPLRELCFAGLFSEGSKMFSSA